MADPCTILIVDDEPHIREIVGFALRQAGYETLEAEDGQQALLAEQSHKPDLIILDIMMPHMDGSEVCRRLRQHSRVPIIFLSSRDDEIDRVLGLELGGDDYVTKPFSPRELVARVKAVLRRLQPAEEKTSVTPEPLCHGKLRLDEQRFEVFWDNVSIVLTATEFRLLHTLMQQPGRVFSREQLMHSAYEENIIVTDRTIDSHVRRLRAKFKALDAGVIETVHGVGYRLGSCG